MNQSKMLLVAALLLSAFQAGAQTVSSGKDSMNRTVPVKVWPDGSLSRGGEALLFDNKVATTTTGTSFASNGGSVMVIGWATAGTYSATITVYGTNVYCGTSCAAASLGATSVGTITSDGGTVDNATYLYYFALISAYTSGTLSAKIAIASGSVTLKTPAGDSAMDETANAVMVKQFVTEGAVTATAADIDQVGAKTIITVDIGSLNASRMMCIFQNTDVAANTNLDEFNIYMAPAGYTATSMPVAYTEADFASPTGALLMVRTGAGGDTTDATPDTTLDESDYMIIWLDVSGMDSVTFQASAAADNAAVDAKCTYN